MTILITGNMGYIGPVLSQHLRSTFPSTGIIGYDSGFFANCITHDKFPEVCLNGQYFGDIRDFPESLLDSVDTVVHLAAISNDPMGKQFESVTEEINFRAGIRLIELAKQKGVKSFVFASSCSIYGQGSENSKKENDPLCPLTAYARSKVAFEETVSSLDLGDMAVTCLRFATACGFSSRLRLDLVLNDFVACAITSGKITVLSDGTPWRPLIDVKDMARAIEWAILRENHGCQLLKVNVGSDLWNYQIVDLALAVKSVIPSVDVTINEKAQPDKRSYKVDFSLFKRLAPRHQPLSNLSQSINEIREGLIKMDFKNTNFRQSGFMRLTTLQKHIELGYLDKSLRWTEK